MQGAEIMGTGPDPILQLSGTDRWTNTVSLPCRLLPTLVVSLPLVSYTQPPISSRVAAGPSTCQLLTCHSFSSASPSPCSLSLYRLSPALVPTQSLCTGNDISCYLQYLPLPTWTLRSGTSAACGDKFVLCTCPGTTSHCCG